MGPVIGAEGAGSGSVSAIRIFKHQAGEKIMKGDRVLFHGNSGEIERVASHPSDPETDCYYDAYGGGVMVPEPKAFGRTFLTDTEHAEDLMLVRPRQFQPPM
jgi:hypothetical protein